MPDDVFHFMTRITDIKKIDSGCLTQKTKYINKELENSNFVGTTFILSQLYEKWVYTDFFSSSVLRYGLFLKTSGMMWKDGKI